MIYSYLELTQEATILKISESRNLRPYNQDQMALFPPSVRSLIEDDHLCMIVNDVVKAMDLSCLYQKVSHEGNPAYHPAMMLKILFYAYARGVFSSRNIAQAVRENIPFIFLAAWQKPDFRTINDFRKNNLEELGFLFAQTVQLCNQLGMVKLGHVAIDGTKIKANASDAKTYDIRRIEKEIKRWLEQAEAIDQAEDALYGSDKTGDEIPEEIRDQGKRIEKLKELKKQLEESGKEKINKTDPDAVFMKTGNGIQTSYNAQVSADTEHQVIVASDVTNQASDVEQLLPMVEQTEENTSGEIKQCSADAGYSSGENIKAMEKREIDAYIPDREYQAQQRGKTTDDFHKEQFIYNENRDCYICPEGEPLPFSHLQKRKNKQPLRIYRGRNCVACHFFGICTSHKNGRTISRHPYEKELRQMRQKLDSNAGKAVYGKRKYTVEPPFGHIKSIMGFTSFMLRGIDKVKGEFKLVSIAHNLRKIWLYLKANQQNLAGMCPAAGF
jgi:transposase